MEFSIDIFLSIYFFQTSVNCKYFCRLNESFANKKVREHDKCFDYDAMQDAYIWLLFMFVMLYVCYVICMYKVMIIYHLLREIIGSEYSRLSIQGYPKKVYDRVCS